MDGGTPVMIQLYLQQDLMHLSELKVYFVLLCCVVSHERRKPLNIAVQRVSGHVQEPAQNAHLDTGAYCIICMAPEIN